MICFIYRDEYYNPETTNSKGIAELIIAKQRNGPRGKVLVRFASSCTRFDNLAQGEYPERSSRTSRPAHARERNAVLRGTAIGGASAEASDPTGGAVTASRRAAWARRRSPVRPTSPSSGRTSAGSNVPVGLSIAARVGRRIQGGGGPGVRCDVPRSIAPRGIAVCVLTALLAVAAGCEPPLQSGGVEMLPGAEGRLLMTCRWSRGDVGGEEHLRRLPEPIEARARRAPRTRRRCPRRSPSPSDPRRHLTETAERSRRRARRCKIGKKLLLEVDIFDAGLLRSRREGLEASSASSSFLLPRVAIAWWHRVVRSSRGSRPPCRSSVEESPRPRTSRSRASSRKTRLRCLRPRAGQSFERRRCRSVARAAGARRRRGSRDRRWPAKATPSPPWSRWRKSSAWRPVLRASFPVEGMAGDERGALRQHDGVSGAVRRTSCAWRRDHRSRSHATPSHGRAPRHT